MSRYSNDDIYLDLASGVLKNRFGITDADILNAAEADLAAARSRELALAPLEGNFDLKHLQAIHRYLFGDLYEWAGELRTVDISKNDNLFAHHAYIATAAKSIFAKLASENRLAELELGEFSRRAAYYFAEINALHPFREGNGRTQREFLSNLAQVNGIYVAWENVAPAEMLQASIESFKGDATRLTAILHRICNR
jgi:cell filamentation protein